MEVCDVISNLFASYINIKYKRKYKEALKGQETLFLVFVGYLLLTGVTTRGVTHQRMTHLRVTHPKSDSSEDDSSEGDSSQE